MSFILRLSVTSILISSLILPSQVAGAASFCATRFEKLFG